MAAESSWGRCRASRDRTLRFTTGARARVEPLEVRRMLSAAISGTTLVITGEPNAKNVITVGMTPDGSGVNVAINRGAVQSFDATRVRLVQITGGARRDLITIARAAAAFNVETRIDAGAGNDAVAGGDGRDVILGGDGKDTVDAGGGDDQVMGGGGNDRIADGAGDDYTDGGTGRDNVTGDAGNDTLRGDAGNDRMTGGDGDDNLLGGDGKDRLDGGGGDDQCYGDDGNDALAGGDGANTLVGGPGRNRFAGAGGREGNTIDPGQSAPRPEFPAPTVPDFPPLPVPAPDVNGGTVSGTVTDAAGKPVAGAYVTLGTVDTEFATRPLLPQPNADGSADGGGGVASAAAFITTTDSRGKFEIENLPVGQYVATAGMRGFGSATQDVAVTANETTTVTLTLQPEAPPPEAGQGNVTGTVTDANGASVGGAEVTLLPAFPYWDGNDGEPRPLGAARGANAAGVPVDLAFPYPGPVAETTTAADGTFSFSGVEAGRYTVVVNKPDVGFGRAAVSVVKDQTATVAVTLEPIREPPPPPPEPPPPATDVGAVQGTVRTASGQPASGVDVVLYALDFQFPPMTDNDLSTPPAAIYSTKTDASGRYTLHRVPVGKATITAYGVDRSLATADVTVTRNGTATVDLTLSASQPPPPPVPPAGTDVGTVKGTVKDASGNAVADAAVELYPGDGFIIAIYPPPDGAYSAKTDAAGEFTIERVAAGTYSVLAYGPNGASANSVRVTVAKGQAVTLNLTLTGEPPTPVPLPQPEPPRPDPRPEPNPRPSPTPEPQPQSGPVVTTLTGVLRGGINAIGGDTTGWILTGDGVPGGQIDVDVSAVAGQADALDGKAVTITGELTTRDWVERGPQRVLVATRIAPAGAVNTPPRDPARG